MKSNFYLLVSLLLLCSTAPSFGLNNDGKTDIVWHDPSSLANQGWFLNNVTLLQTVTLTPNVATGVITWTFANAAGCTRSRTGVG